MIAQTSLSPYMPSQVPSYQVSAPGVRPLRGFKTFAPAWHSNSAAMQGRKLGVWTKEVFLYHTSLSLDVLTDPVIAGGLQMGAKVLAPRSKDAFCILISYYNILINS